jgi:hypothetical protein
MQWPGQAARADSEEIKAQETRASRGGKGKGEKGKIIIIKKRFFWYLFSKPLTKTRFEVGVKRDLGLSNSTLH